MSNPVRIPIPSWCVTSDEKINLYKKCKTLNFPAFILNSEQEARAALARYEEARDAVPRYDCFLF